MGTRENILESNHARDEFCRGVVLLDQEDSGFTTRDISSYLQRNFPDLRITGTQQMVSTYDLFVLWHILAMRIQMPPGNAAHSAPVFLPWHRMYLIRLEEQLQRVLNNPDFGLPYWDWATDGELGQSEQRNAALWTSDYLGTSRGDVTHGQVAGIRVRIAQNPVSGDLVSAPPRPLRRNAGIDVRTLPNQRQVRRSLSESTYDAAPFNFNSTRGHRNYNEGWTGGVGPQMHNRVHVWVGGDMLPGTSPNDPSFFLNHCNVDRIWEAWMQTHGQQYGGANYPRGHRLNDAMVALLGAALTPAQVLNPSEWYDYDSLDVG